MIHDARSRALEAAAFSLKLASLFAALALVAGAARAGGTPLGDIPLTTNLYNASEVDALLEGAGGGADLSEVSNLVAGVVAEGGASVAATETWRIILADHQRRLDAIEEADGTGYITAAQAEDLVRTRVEAMVQDEMQEWYESAADVPEQSVAVDSTTINANTSGVSVRLSPRRATRYYASAANSRTIGFSAFSGVGNIPCILILERFSGVSWPSGARVETAYTYNSGIPNVYAIYKLNGVIYAKKLYP